MTEKELRTKIVNTAEKYLGYSEKDGRHKQIIDIYNGHTPLACGYKVKYTDSWCATFVSAVAILSGLTDIIPTECSCPRQIELWKKLGRWVESDSYIPSPGDIIYYDWEDGANYSTTDNTGVADHVGIVSSVTASAINVIEGNYNDMVKYRTVPLNGRFIRGFGVPDYAKKADLTSGFEFVCKPKKIQIFSNTSGMTKEQIKAKTKCTALINGGLFSWTNKGLLPVCLLKVDGKVLANDGYTYFGIGWNGNNEGLTMSNSMQTFDNYIACVAMVKDFNPLNLIYNSDMGGARQRTAFGVMDDGDIWMFMTKQATTPEQLRQIALNAGCKYAIMLDGGASTQGIFPNATISSPTRPIVQNYICVWDENANIEDLAECPYNEPTAILRFGMSGEGVMWLQWQLNQNGSKLTVDGQFGAGTYSALVMFQAHAGIERDGVCGPATIAALLNANSKDTAKTDICPYSEPVLNITKGSFGEGAKWVQWMLNKHGNNLEVDGDFGPKSYEALLKFQHSVHLNMDGICGPATRSKLKEDF